LYIAGNDLKKTPGIMRSLYGHQVQDKPKEKKHIVIEKIKIKIKKAGKWHIIST
jgi:hypothetical protein